LCEVDPHLETEAVAPHPLRQERGQRPHRLGVLDDHRVDGVLGVAVARARTRHDHRPVADMGGRGDTVHGAVRPRQ